VTNRIELEAAAEERLFDAMLDEVVAAWAVPRRSTAAPRSRWLAAAIVLLGLAVVIGVVVTSRTGPAVAVAPQEPVPLPPMIKVRGMAELQKADRQIENLSCAIEGPDFELLQQFARLRALRVEQDHNLPHPTLVQAAWSLAPVANCRKLESLSVGPLARFTAAELAPVVVLPNLHSLELVGAEKDVDTDFAAVLAKLPLRSLVLDAVHVLPEGLRALGELPLLERLELRDCTGLEKCDLKHLYRLRQLRALAVRGLGREREVQLPISTFTTTLGVDQAISIQLPEVRDGKFVLAITGEWMRGLASALPDLRELDLAQTRIDDDVLAALPRGLTFLGLRATLGYSERGITAVGALPELRTLAIGDPIPSVIKMGSVPVSMWLPMLRQKMLHGIEFTGVPTQEFLEVLRGQEELRELTLTLPAEITIFAKPGQTSIEYDLGLDFSCLAVLPELQCIQLRNANVIEKTIRRSAPARVRIEILAP